MPMWLQLVMLCNFTFGRLHESLGHAVHLERTSLIILQHKPVNVSILYRCFDGEMCIGSLCHIFPGMAMRSMCSRLQYEGWSTSYPEAVTEAVIYQVSGNLLKGCWKCRIALQRWAPLYSLLLPLALLTKLLQQPTQLIVSALQSVLAICTGSDPAQSAIVQASTRLPPFCQAYSALGARQSMVHGTSAEQFGNAHVSSPRRLAGRLVFLVRW